jgi:two-component system, cell cycle sensor histidine kinase and response regulator CckA
LAAEQQSGVRARVIVVEEGRVTGRYLLDGEATVGRGPDASIYVSDEEISRRHATITPLGGDRIAIKDLDSRNGTFVNGARVGQATVGPDDNLAFATRVVLKVTRYDPAEEDVRRRERFEALGRLTAGVIHDLNNLLGAILATAECTRAFRIADRELSDCLDDIRGAATRAAELTPRLVGFVRGDSSWHGTVHFSRLVGEMVELMRRTLGAGIDLRSDVAADLFVYGNAGELQQVLLNLCLNARDAMPNGGRLIVSAQPLPDGPRAMVELRVTDQGSGMDSATRERIFEPFFTTKGDRGSGIGLSTVKEIVSMHGGSIRVDSALGAGTSFEVSLPSAPAVEQGNPHSTEPPTSHQLLLGRTVLVVDDELHVRKSMTRVLRQAAATVVEASSGAEAIDRYAAQRPDLVLLDLGMPHMSGEEALRKLRALDRGARVVVVTGASDERSVEGARAAGAMAVVTKPFHPHQLVAEITRVLATRLVREPTTAGVVDVLENTVDGGDEPSGGEEDT